LGLTSALIVAAFLLLLGLLIYQASQASHRDAQRKLHLAHHLGFAPCEADAALAARISRLYWRGGKYQLRNVFCKIVGDGEIYLFDLVDRSSEDDSWTEQQAVAILSSHLKLPCFSLFPKVDEKYLLSGLANRVLEWGMSARGGMVKFPEFPEFNARYIVTSDESDATRQFLDERLAQYFAQIQMCRLQAGGDIFTFSNVVPRFRAANQDGIARRVECAMEIFRLLMRQSDAYQVEKV
jgi:hypothetical protein